MKNNAPIPPSLSHDTVLCRIYGIKSIDSVGESIRNKTSYKELIYLAYERRELQTKSFELL